MDALLIENSTTTLLPGPGLVHRCPGVVLVLPAPRPEQVTLARALLRVCGAAAADPTGRSTVLALAGLLTRSGEAGPPPFGLALDTDRGLVVLLHDAVEAEVCPAGRAPVRLSGADSLAWVERRFEGPVTGFALWPAGTAHQTYPGTGTAAAEGISLNLSRGTLAGGGAVVTRSEAAGLAVTAERSALPHPTTGHRVGHPDRGYGSPLPETPRLGQPQAGPPFPYTPEPAAGQPIPHHPGFPGTGAPDRPETSVGAAVSHHDLPGRTMAPAADPPNGREVPVPGRAGPPLEPPGAPVTRAPEPHTNVHQHFDRQPDPEAAPPAPPRPVRTPNGGIAVPRLALPPIEGVLCARGHFTDPDAAYCAICGISMQQASRQITRRPRPPLGVLVLDDGSSMTVDGDIVLGRDPSAHPAVVAGDAKPMFLNDEVDGVSRVHARITLVGWTVCLTDEDSANGTYLTGPGGDGRRPVRGEVPVELANGTTIRIGRRVLTFDAYHSAGE